METAKSKDGTIIAYDALGRGPAVALVCGAQTTRTSNAPLARLLAQNFTVFNYDRRGRGESGDTLPYMVEREVEDLEAVVQAAGGAAGVYGISSGAVLALQAAASGADITALALYDAPFDVDVRAARPPVDHATPMAKLISEERPGDAVEYFMAQVVGLPGEFVAQARGAPWWAASEAMAHTLVYDMTLVRDYSLLTIPLASIHIPVLVMAGGASPELLQRAARATAEALPHSTLLFIEGQDHNVAPEALAPALTEYFASRKEMAA